MFANAENQILRQTARSEDPVAFGGQVKGYLPKINARLLPFRKHGILSSTESAIGVL